MNQTIQALFFVVATLLSSSGAYGADIVVIGKLITNEPMKGHKYECSDGELCMHSWWKAVIQVEHTLGGPPLSGRIAAAVSQHIAMNETYKKAVRYFTLESIEDPATRKLLHADYYLKEGSIDPPGEK
jgi:hypothetical protein